MCVQVARDLDVPTADPTEKRKKRRRGLMGLMTSFARSVVDASVGVVVSLGVVACTGLEAGIEYPRDLPSGVGQYLLTAEGQPNPPVVLSGVQAAPSTCDKLDTHPVVQKLNQEAFATFLASQGVQVTQKKARDNLYWYDFKNGRESPQDFLRLRLAVLDDAPHASAYLHQSLLEHGPGWWGFRQSNVAVLAPKANLTEAIAFALTYKLFCWGIFTYAGLDNAYVIPGPYAEL